MTSYVFEPAFDLPDDVCAEMVTLVQRVISRAARRNDVRAYFAEVALSSNGNTMLFAQTVVFSQAILACFGNRNRIEQSMADAAETACEVMSAQFFAENVRNARIDRDLEDGIRDSLDKLTDIFKELRRHMGNEASIFNPMNEREASRQIGRPFNVSEMRSSGFGRGSDRGSDRSAFGRRDERDDRREGPLTMNSLRDRVSSGFYEAGVGSRQVDEPAATTRNKYYTPPGQATTPVDTKEVEKQPESHHKLSRQMRELFDKLSKEDLESLQGNGLNLSDAPFETQRLIYNAWVPSNEQTHIPYPRAGTRLSANISSNTIYITEVKSMNELDHRPPANVGFRAPVRPEEIPQDDTVVIKRPTNEEIIVELSGEEPWVFEPSVEAAQTNLIVDRPVWKRRAGRVVDGQYRKVQVMTVLCLSSAIKSALTTNIKSASTAELCKNFRTVYALTQANPGMRGDYNQLMKLNKALTQRANDFIHYNLSIPTTSMESFEQDAETLVSHFLGKGLNFAAQAADKFLHDLIVNTFTFVGADELAALHGDIAPEEFAKSDIEVSVRSLALIDVAASLGDLGLEKLITHNSFIVNAVVDDDRGDFHNETGSTAVRLRPGVAGIAEYVFADEMTDVLRIITRDNDVVELMLSPTKTSYILHLVD